MSVKFNFPATTLPFTMIASGYSSNGSATMSLDAGTYLVYSPSGVIAESQSNFNSSNVPYLLRNNLQPLFLFKNDNSVKLYSFTDGSPVQGIEGYPLVEDGTYLQGARTAPVGGRIWYSTDGFDWTLKDSGIGLNPATRNSGFGTFVYNANVTNKYVYCAATTSTTQAVWTSTDSVTWTSRTIPVAPASAAGCGSVLINSNATNKYTLNQGGTSNMILYSTDAVTWTQATVATGTTALGAAAVTNGTTSTNEVFIYATGSTTNNITTSTDAVTWTSRTTGQAATVSALAWFNSQYVAFYTSANTYHYSTNGITWTSATLPVNITASTSSVSASYISIYDGKLTIPVSNSTVGDGIAVRAFTTNNTTWTLEAGTGIGVAQAINGNIIYYLPGSVRYRRPLIYTIYKLETIPALP